MKRHSWSWRRLECKSKGTAPKVSRRIDLMKKVVFEEGGEKEVGPSGNKERKNKAELR